jgi:hypothetical protein
VNKGETNATTLKKTRNEIWKEETLRIKLDKQRKRLEYELDQTDEEESINFLS